MRLCTHHKEDNEFFSRTFNYKPSTMSKPLLVEFDFQGYQADTLISEHLSHILQTFHVYTAASKSGSNPTSRIWVEREQYVKMVQLFPLRIR